MWPSEILDEERKEATGCATLADEMHKAVGEADDECDGPIDRRLEQDRLDQRRAVEAAHKPHLVGHQHRLTDQQSGYRGEHEARERDAALLEDHLFGPQ